MALLEGIQLAGLMAALLLPWIAGTALVASLLPNARISLLLGHGYLVGQTLVIVLLLAWDGAGLALTFAPPAAILAAIALLGGATWWLQSAPLTLPRPRMRALRHLLWLVPLAWFVFERGGTLLSEQMLRPLYAWDAWMNWVPRAVVWFDHESLTPFVDPEQWLQASPGEVVYTLGNWRASDYPPGIPLILLWHMVGAGTDDHTLLYLPWLLLPASCAVALWGHLRNHGLPPAAGALAVFALLSQPLVNTHAVLAGYADLWLAVSFGLGAMALAEWQRTTESRYAVLAALMALACTLFKTPGLAFAGILVLAAALMAWRPPPRLLWWIGSLAAIGLLCGLVAGMWPGLHRQGEALASLDLPGSLPTLDLRLAPLLPYLWESLFLHANWHLLWSLLIASLVVGSAFRGRVALENVALLVLLASLGFLLFVFGFTHYFRQAENGVTFNRTLLYLAPLAVFGAFEQLAALFRRDDYIEETRR